MAEYSPNIAPATGGLEEAAPRYRFVIVGLVALATLMNFLILFNLGVLLPSISDEMDLSPSEQGWLGSSAVVANLIFALPLGWWLSRMNTKLVTTITLLGGAFFVFLQGWAPIFAVLLLGRVLFGLCGIAREPVRAMLTQQWFPPREIVVVNGFLNATIGVSIAAGFFLTPFILVWTGDDWRMTLYIFAAVTLAVGVAWQALGRERITPGYRERTTAQSGTPLRSLLKYRQLWAVGMGLFGANLLWMGFITFWPTLMLERYDVSLITSGTLMGVNGIASSASGLLFAYMMARKDTGRQILLVCGALLAGTTVGMVMTDNLALLVILTLVNGLGWGFFTVVMTIPFQLPDVKPREIAVAVGFLEMVMWGGGVVGPVLTGFVQEATGDLHLALAVLAVFGLFLSAGAVFLPSGGGSQAVRQVARAYSSVPSVGKSAGSERGPL